MCTGDMMESQPAYMGDALFDEWLKTLDALKEMNFDTVLPGHGVLFHEKSPHYGVSKPPPGFHVSGDRASQTRTHARAGRSESGSDRPQKRISPKSKGPAPRFEACGGCMSGWMKNLTDLERATLVSICGVLSKRRS